MVTASVQALLAELPDDACCALHTAYAVLCCAAQEGIHPLLARSLPSDAFGGLEAQAALAEITAKLKSYRPSHTVFEAEVAAPRRGEGAGALRQAELLGGGGWVWGGGYVMAGGMFRRCAKAHAGQLLAGR
jgi:hypothetical protein